MRDLLSAYITMTDQQTSDMRQIRSMMSATQRFFWRQLELASCEFYV